MPTPRESPPEGRVPPHGFTRIRRRTRCSLWSAVTTAGILLDTTAPSIDSLAVNVIDPVSSGYGAQYLGSASDAGSGVAAHRFSLNGVDWSDWIPTTGVFFSEVDLHKGLLGGTVTGGDRIVDVEVRDAAGNMTAPSEQHVPLPTVPVDPSQTATMKITMSMPLAPVTGATFTLHPNYPAEFVMPSDAFCQWILSWGSQKSLIEGPPDQDYGEIWYQRPASAGGCTEWTFTLPYTVPRRYYRQFTLMSKTLGPPDFTGRVTYASIDNQLATEFHAASRQRWTWTGSRHCAERRSGSCRDDSSRRGVAGLCARRSLQLA